MDARRSSTGPRNSTAGERALLCTMRINRVVLSGGAGTTQVVAGDDAKLQSEEAPAQGSLSVTARAGRPVYFGFYQKRNEDSTPHQ